MNRVVHFEIVSRDPERTAAFYGAVFGWKTVRLGGPFDYWRLIAEDGAPDDGRRGEAESEGEAKAETKAEAEAKAKAKAKAVAKAEAETDARGEGSVGGVRAARGINGAAVRPVSDNIPPGTINTIHVTDLDVYAARVLERGGRTLSEPIELPGVGRFRYCADPDGIPFGLIEYLS